MDDRQNAIFTKVAKLKAKATGRTYKELARDVGISYGVFAHYMCLNYRWPEKHRKKLIQVLDLGPALQQVGIID